MTLLSTQTGQETGTAVGNAVRAVRDSFSIKVALLGVGFVLLGYVLQTGVLAAMFAVWGAGLGIIGVASYAAIWRTRR